MKTISSVILASLILSMVFFTACKPDGSYEYWIDNQTDSSLYVIFRKINNQRINRIEIESDAKIMIANYETMNGLFDEQDNFLKYWCDSLGIFTDTLKKSEVEKEYLQRSSWDYSQKEDGIFDKSGKNIYTLTVLNSDLKK